MKFVLFFAFALFLGFAATLAHGQSNPPGSIDAGVGKEFTLRLDANPTTGYEWRLAKPLDESIVKFVGKDYKAPSTTKRLGAGGEEVWTFKAVGKGKTTIELEYVRPWEKDVQPSKRQSTTVNVR